MKLLLLSLGLLFSFTALALPQKVQLTGSFQSRHGGSYDVSVYMNLKKQDSQKAKYTGKMTFDGQILNQTQSFEFTMNTVKNKSEGVVNTYDGYIAFDSKSAYTLEVGQQLQLGYSEWQRNNDHFCNPFQDNFCPPTDFPDRISDEGVLTLTVVQAQ